jgi:hypothetical protein
VNGDSKFWTQFANAAAAKLVAGKWVEAPATDKDFSQLAEFFNTTALLNGFFSGNVPTGLSKAGTSTVNGQQAIVLLNNQGKIYGAASGQPYILKVTATSGSSTGTMTFSNYNKSVSVTAPSNALDLSQLGLGA